MAPNVLVPSSILVVGSGSASTRAGTTLRSLRRNASAGGVAHIDTDSGLDAVRAALARPASPHVDCVLVYDLSPREIAGLIPALCRLGARTLVLGAGDTEGLPELIGAARRTGIRVLGPGAYGPFTGDSGLLINPVHGTEPTGLGVFAQSGNVVLDVVAALRRTGDLLPRFAWGLGRSSDLGLAEAVEAAAADDACTAIAIHAEGFNEGGRLLRAVSEAARSKPVLLLQGGTSAAGSASALSHTGSLSTSRAIVSGLFRQAGAQVVERVDDLTVLGAALSTLREPRADAVAVVADGGGQATLMMDALADRDVPTASLSASTVERVANLLGAGSHVANPVDVGVSPVARPTVAFEVASVLLRAAEVDCIVVVGVVGGYAVHFAAPELEGEETAAAGAIADEAARLGKTLVFVSSYSGDLPPAYRALRRAGFPVVDSIDDAATIVSAVRERAAFLRTADARSRFINAAEPSDSDSSGSAVVLDEAASRGKLAGLGLPLGSFDVVRTADEAVAAMEPGREYVIKIVSPDISHKSDAGGVRLRVARENAVAEYHRLLSDVRRNEPDARIDGVSVAPMAEPGVEILVGAYRDPQFGACIAVGSGGILAELIRDTVVRAAPVTSHEAAEMLTMTRSARLFSGYRGAPASDLDGLVELIVTVSEIAAAHPEILEIDLNPVIVSPTSPQVADARVVLRQDAPAPHPGTHMAETPPQHTTTSRRPT